MVAVVDPCCKNDVLLDLESLVGDWRVLISGCLTVRPVYEDRLGNSDPDRLEDDMRKCGGLAGFVPVVAAAGHGASYYRSS